MAFSFQSNRVALIAFVIALGSFSIISSPAVAADIVINFNEDLLVKLPPRVATIVVGNPLMVDVHMAARGFMVITAKSYGETNIIFLDRAGAVLMEPTILVRRHDDDEPVVYNGVDRDDDVFPSVTSPNASILHAKGAKRIGLPLGN